MTKMQRIRNIAFGVLTLLLVVFLIALGEFGPLVAVFLVGISFIVYGVRYIVYFRSMARHMVGGKSMLYRGIIVLDLGILALTMIDNAPILILMYLLFLHGMSGVIDILRGREAKQMGAPLWKRIIIHGAVDLAIVAVGTIFLREQATVLYVYCAGMVYSGVVRIVSAFRRTAIVYIA